MTAENVRDMKRPAADAEQDVRVELAALYRLCVHFGWTDLTATHISARIPGDDTAYLMNCYDLLFEEISASTLMRVGFDGVHSDPDRTLNNAGHLIHSTVLQARPDINFVMHSHTRAGIAVSAMPGGLRPLSQHSGFVMGTLVSHPYQDVTEAEEECALLASDLGSNYCMLLENHGLLTVGRTAAEVFIYHYFLEMSCKIQVDALGGTQSPIEISPKAMDDLQTFGDPDCGPHGNREWKALLRMLDRKDPSYRD